MTGLYPLDWAILSISILNTIILLWLALIVFLNSDRHNMGVWIMCIGLTLGGAFFVSHTAILGQSLNLNWDGLNFWWQFGWIPVTLAPFAWYSVILWFHGFWEGNITSLRRRHRIWFASTVVLGSFLAVVLIASKPIPDFANLIQLNLTGNPTLFGIPVLLISIPIYMAACIGLSIDVLLKPNTSPSFHTQMGRQRSRYWLLAVAASLLVVSLLVFYFVLRIVLEARQGSLLNIQSITIGLFDLALSSMIAIAIVLLGQAIVSYEVFTGRVLPRRQLNYHWRVVIIGALAVSGIISWSFVQSLRPIYTILLLTVLMTGLYALYTWRTLIVHDEFVKRLRPFASNQQLVNRFVDSQDEQYSHAVELFHKTCTEILNTTKALLVPKGPLAPLVGSPLLFPQTTSLEEPQSYDVSGREPIPLETENSDGFSWAIPLWAERGLSGVLYIARKEDNSFYAQEEMDVAQASGERIIDLLAAEQMTKRLLEIQRRQSTESSINELRIRRVLHDEILPTLHEAIIGLGGSEVNKPDSKASIKLLTQVHHDIAKLIRRPSMQIEPLHSDSEFLSILHSTIENEFSGSFDHITWNNSVTDLGIQDRLAQDIILGAVRELVRNAAIHGRGDYNQELILTVSVECNTSLYIHITDNGKGLSEDPEKSPIGTGSGLALHRALLAVIGADCIVEPLSPRGIRSTIILPQNFLTNVTL